MLSGVALSASYTHGPPSVVLSERGHLLSDRTTAKTTHAGFADDEGLFKAMLCHDTLMVRRVNSALAVLDGVLLVVRDTCKQSVGNHSSRYISSKTKPTSPLNIWRRSRISWSSTSKLSRRITSNCRWYANCCGSTSDLSYFLMLSCSPSCSDDTSSHRAASSVLW